MMPLLARAHNWHLDLFVNSDLLSCWLIWSIHHKNITFWTLLLASFEPVTPSYQVPLTFIQDILSY